MKTPARMLAAFLAIVSALAVTPASAAEEAWSILRQGGAVAIMRHARAPGTGDPPQFRLDDCSTQRNLSAEGREQARRIGQRFAAEGIAVDRVLSSRWCRALDTARLAFGERVESFEPLNSFFSERDRADGQTAAARRLIGAWRGPGTLVLVTHQVNITALTGIFPAEGEILVLAPSGENGFTVRARVSP